MYSFMFFGIPAYKLLDLNITPNEIELKHKVTIWQNKKKLQ